MIKGIKSCLAISLTVIAKGLTLYRIALFAAWSASSFSFMFAGYPAYSNAISIFFSLSWEVWCLNIDSVSNIRIFMFFLALREFEKIIASETFKSLTIFMTWKITKYFAIKIEQTLGSLYDNNVFSYYRFNEFFITIEVVNLKVLRQTQCGRRCDSPRSLSNRP